MNKRLQHLKNACRKNIAFTARIQSVLQFFGIAIHNPFRDECCSDFACCKPYKGDGCAIHVSQDALPFNNRTWYSFNKPVGTPGRNCIKHTMWIFKLFGQKYEVHRI